VDFWDLTKLLARRWYLCLPVLFLAGAGSMATLHSVKPSYTLDVHVQMIPPIPTKVGQDPTAHNPWLQLGVFALGNAAAVTIQDTTVLEALHAAGESDDFTAVIDNSTPLLTIEVVGTSPAQVITTANDLKARFNTAVLSLQQAYGVSQENLITTRSLEQSTPASNTTNGNIKTSTSSQKRAVIAVGAAGVLLAVGFTIAVDAWLRRRARYKAGLGTGGESLDGLTDMAPLGPPAATPRTAATGGAESKAPAVPDWGIVASKASRGRGSNPPTIEHRSPTPNAPNETVVGFQVPQPEAHSNTSTDSTVVLPLSLGTRRGKDGLDEERRAPR
jgi:hypothetical protein